MKNTGVDAPPNGNATSVKLRRQLDEIHEHLRLAVAGLVRVQAILAALDIADNTRPGEEHRPRTGYRFVRGTHSGTYIRDPQGTDPLPFGYTIPEGSP